MVDDTGAPVLIGTSGWSYDHWQGPFYPRDLPRERWLEHYAGRLGSVEINSSFYRLPSREALRHWYDTVPDDFVFAAKASRYLTHIKKLKDPQSGIAAFFECIGLLGDKLGPILFQLPPRWRFNPDRLAGFLDALSGDFRYAFEFRDRSWHNAQTRELLAERNAAFCIYELDGFVSARQVTADFVYVRLHGPGGPYRGSYDGRTLSGWASAFSTWSAQGRRGYCYFDNDEAGYAAANAVSLQSMLTR